MELSRDEIEKAAKEFIFNAPVNLNLKSKNDELVDAFSRGASFAAEKLNLKGSEKHKKKVMQTVGLMLVMNME